MGAAEAAECTKALQTRWEAAMTEAMQVYRLLLHLGAKEPDQPTLCRIVKNASELTATGQEYLPACDPLDAGRSQIFLARLKEKLAQTDTSPCSMPARAGAGKK